MYTGLRTVSSATPEELAEAEFIVCAKSGEERRGVTGLVRAECHDCHTPIIHRDNVPEGTDLVCIDCAWDRLRSAEVSGGKVH